MTDAENPEPLPLPHRDLLRRPRARASSPPSSITTPAASSPIRRRARGTGYLPLWTLLPITLVLIVTQEMCSRMGAVTGKGLSDLIREEFGLRITFLMMALLVLANLTNVMAEFAGIASSLELFHISRYISVPLAARGGLVAGGEGQLPERREDLPVRLRALRHLHHLRHSW